MIMNDTELTQERDLLQHQLEQVFGIAVRRKGGGSLLRPGESRIMRPNVDVSVYDFQFVTS